MFQAVLKGKGEIPVLIRFIPGRYFRWVDREQGTDITGQYRISGNSIILLANDSDEVLTVRYRFEGNKLVILTDDGFTFHFRRLSAPR